MIQIQRKIRLAPRTSIGVGGPAAYFAKVTKQRDLIDGAQWAREKKLDLFVLGGGSNVLISDAGFDGLVLFNAIGGAEWETRSGEWLVRAKSGSLMDDLCYEAARRNAFGIECLSGIPGTVGAAPIQNIGAYGQELSDSLVGLHAWDRKGQTRVYFDAEACGFSYRNSRFKSKDADQFIILEVVFRLYSNPARPIEHPQLLTQLKSQQPTVQEIRDAVLSVRRSKSMVCDPNDPDSRSCGSFFINPTLSRQHYRQFCIRAPCDHPSHPVVGGTKIPAAWLIERAGYEKGVIRGNTGLSNKHALAIINRGGATAAEIHAFAREIKAAVALKYGIDLQQEPQDIGF